MRIVYIVIVAACWFWAGLMVGTKMESSKWHKYWDQILASGVGVRPGPLPVNRAIKVCAAKQSHLFGMMWFYKSPPPTWLAMCMNGHSYDLAGNELKDDER